MRYKINPPRKADVAIMTPEGAAIAVTDENGEFEADYPFEEDPRYNYITPIEAATRREDATKSDE